MNKYEAMYIIKPEVDAEAIKALIEKFAGVVTQNGGTIDGIDEWGKRKLAYPINYINDGYYVLMHFTANPEFPTELGRIFNITEDILRSIVICKEE